MLSFTIHYAGPWACAAADDEQYHRNWPHWRGPAQNGLVLHGSPPLRWSERENIKWKVAIPGRGHATPVIWENKVFLLTAVPAEDDSERLAFTVLCLDRNTGRTIWQRVARIDEPHQDIQPTNSYSSGSPVTDGEHLVVSFGSYGLYCYDLDGNLLWERDLGNVDVTWGEGASPALAGNVVIVLQDNNEASFVYGFSVATGEQLWKKARDEGSSWTTPYVLARDGQTQVIINGSNAVRSYDPQTGEVLWQCSGLGINVTPMVVVDEDVVYAMSGQRTSPRAMAIRLGGSGDLTGTDAVLWKLNRGTPYVASPLLYDGRLYFVQHVTSILSCLDAATGEPHYLQRRLDGLTNVYASPIGVNDRVYIVGREGTTLVLENSNELKVLSRNELDEGFDASPAVVGKELFLRGRSHLYCIAEDLKMQSLAVGMELQQALAVLKNNIVDVEEVGFGAVKRSEEDGRVKYVAKPIYESDDALILIAREDKETGSHKIEGMYWHIKYEEDSNLPKAHRGERYLDLQSIDVSVFLPNESGYEPSARSDYNPFE